MIKSKKIIKEDVEIEDQIDETAAADSLSPNSHPADNSKSRYETLSAMIGAAATMRDEDLTKWYDQMIASSKDLGKEIPSGAAASNKATINAKEETEVDADATLKAAAQEDLGKILDGQADLSEEFKAKASTLFEAAVSARVAALVAEQTEKVSNELQTEFAEIVESLEGQVQAYLDDAAQLWMTENEVAIESTLRTEITEDFMSGLKALFEQNFIDIPESQVDVVEQLTKTVDELESRLNEMIIENSDLKKTTDQSAKKEIVESLTEGLTLVEAEKLKTLSENIDFDSIEDFTTKLTTIKESQFVKEPKASVLNEQLQAVSEDNAPEQTVAIDPQMQKYFSAIKRTVSR